MGCGCTSERKKESWDDYPEKEDGWVMSHDALRRNMNDFVKAMKNVEEKKDNEWMIGSLMKWWPFFVKLVEAHHDHEESIFFPWMSERVKLPQKFSADHKELLERMEKSGDSLTKLAESKEKSKELIEDVQKTFKSLKDVMEEHLLEEEKIGLPLLRKHFKPSEVQKIESDKIIPTLKWWDTGNHIQPLDDEGKSLWMKRVGIPWIIQKLVIWPQVRKYERECALLINQVIDPSLRK
mmetsp:Transcript_20007/g.29966  ORF Transcript_20007/g.29966 Transcript_20007/m.29966 type:complete len:237 (+) Transcript_20007:59-769(+)|eukprot:CAMPEP_0167751862 /NCGR_PEP_ID=MMETSP0110_2-20121227/6813_1 /TAXON_ID=629695 /ORGANISM="Gymnochlora sp., Strain CCMP2014" /LENGTH=236 /DNA_ID=CAMNT_0007637403 /DNA_START=29 /DNA_END=739 /DNA_ORIENTATION=-